jgi:glycosyltransferase involved in cell wall biosynthesis
MISRLDAFHKGMDIAFESIAQLIREGERLQLNVYGSGEDNEYLRKYSEFLGIQDSVVFHGYTDKLEEMWRTEEMLILPSRYEGLAVSMVEAMGFGRIVMRTPFGGAAEWIEDGIDGYICPAPDADMLTSTLRRALTERTNWRLMGLRAYERVKRQLDTRPGRRFLDALESGSERRQIRSEAL